MIKLPWILAGWAISLLIAATSGMYGGYEIANARYQKEVVELKDAHIQALQDRTDQYLEAVRRGDQVSNDFFDALRNMKVVNTSITQEVRKEVEKLVYTDCRLPDSGVDLLKKKVDSVNMRLLSAGDAPGAKGKK